MRVERQATSQIRAPMFWLVDDHGRPVESVNEFLALLAARDYSPNTIRAYAHDLQKLAAFLASRSLGFAQFSPRLATEFLKLLRTTTSKRAAQRLGLTTTGHDEGRRLSPRTCNRILGAVSSFYEYLISVERYGGGENPIVQVPDHAAARAAGRWRPPLRNSSRPRPVRRALRVKTIATLPRPLPEATVAALLAQLRRRRDRAIVQLMLEGGLRPGEVLGLHLDDIAYGRRRVTIRHRDDHPHGVRGKSRRERVVDLHVP